MFCQVLPARHRPEVSACAVRVARDMGRNRIDQGPYVWLDDGRPLQSSTRCAFAESVQHWDSLVSPLNISIRRGPKIRLAESEGTCTLGEKPAVQCSSICPYRLGRTCRDGGRVPCGTGQVEIPVQSYRCDSGIELCGRCGCIRNSA